MTGQSRYRAAPPPSIEGLTAQGTKSLLAYLHRELKRIADEQFRLSNPNVVLPAQSGRIMAAAGQTLRIAPPPDGALLSLPTPVPANMGPGNAITIFIEAVEGTLTVQAVPSAEVPNPTVNGAEQLIYETAGLVRFYSNGVDRWSTTNEIPIAVSRTGVQTPGAVGATGATGATGPQGEQGVQGFPGPPGLDGEEGMPGPPGVQGVRGIPGSMGPPGLDGEDGMSGPPGVPGAQGPQGVPGVAGMMGPPGLAGDDGEMGPPGMPGAPGPQGAAGAPGLTPPPPGIVLSATMHSLELVTGAALSTDYQVSYEDNASGALTPGSSAGNVSTATTTTIQAAPGASVQRTVTGVTVVNKGVTNQTVNVQKDVAGSNIVLVGPLVLGPDERLEFTSDMGWRVFNAFGAERDGEEWQLGVNVGLEAEVFGRHIHIEQGAAFGDGGSDFVDIDFSVSGDTITIQFDFVDQAGNGLFCRTGSTGTPVYLNAGQWYDNTILPGHITTAPTFGSECDDGIVMQYTGGTSANLRVGAINFCTTRYGFHDDFAYVDSSIAATTGRFLGETPWTIIMSADVEPELDASGETNHPGVARFTFGAGESFSLFKGGNSTDAFTTFNDFSHTEWLIRILTSVTGVTLNLGIAADDNPNGATHSAHFRFDQGADASWRAVTRDGGVQTANVDLTGTVAINTWYKLRIQKESNRDLTFTVFTSGGDLTTTVTAATHSIEDSDAINVTIDYSSASTTSILDIDYAQYQSSDLGQRLS
jgi:hypothetical protein